MKINMNSGYDGYSMSNRAVEAYENGERPMSKWTKGDLIYEIKKAIRCDELHPTFNVDTLNKIPVSVLRDLFLEYSSWHHTSSYCNSTSFYSIDEDAIERITDEKLLDCAKKAKEMAARIRQEKEELKEERCKCRFLEWGGTRNHPKATEVIEVGVIKGNWFYRENGSKKSINANGFRVLESIE